MILFSSTAQTQVSTRTTPDIVSTKGISGSLHKENIGTIKFNSGMFSKTKYQESDFLDAHEINENGDFNFVAFFDNSLTNYLHQLDTTLTVDELIQKGNFQFTFYVDGKLIYTENLNVGSGTPRQKNEDTILYRPLISSENYDSWGRFLWMRFFYRNGGNVSLEIGEHTLGIEIRPYLEHNGLRVGDVIAEGEIVVKMAELGEVGEEEKSIQTIQPNSGWVESTADFNEEPIRTLNERIAQKRFKDITSIVVIKNGELLIEEYFNGADRRTLHDTRSVGKSFASTLAGIALKEGHLKSLDQTLNEFYGLKEYANYSQEKGEVTLRSLLTMSSGFLGNDDDYESPGNEENMYPTDDWVRFTLDLPMDKTKDTGEKWEYFTAGAMLMGDIIDETVPQGFEQYADEKLLKPLGITEYKWPYRPKGVPSTAGGMRMRALDFAKYGQLYKNGGTWKGQRIIPEDWVEATMTNYFADKPGQTPYGLLFWNHTFKVNGTSYETYQCRGNGGNYVIVFKDEPLVIVITATAYNTFYGHSQVNLMLLSYILPALM
ncbi:MAG: serine hydrolase [Bacteroidota bacterium]